MPNKTLLLRVSLKHAYYSSSSSAAECSNLVGSRPVTMKIVTEARVNYGVLRSCVWGISDRVP